MKFVPLFALAVIALAVVAALATGGKPWLRPDLFFLNHALRHGMSVEEVAGFLGRPAREVRAKMRQMDEILTIDDTSIVPRPPVRRKSRNHFSA